MVKDFPNAVIENPNKDALPVTDVWISVSVDLIEKTELGILIPHEDLSSEFNPLYIKFP